MTLFSIFQLIQANLSELRHFRRFLLNLIQYKMTWVGMVWPWKYVVLIVNQIRFWPKGQGLAEGAVKHRKKLIRSPEQTVYSVFCLQLLPLLCVSPVIETHLQEAGPAGMFSARGISRINQARMLFLPPGKERQPWAPVTVSALCGSLAVGRSQQGFLEERTWNIRTRGPKLRKETMQNL